MNIEEYVKTYKGSTNVTWALFVRDNIKKGDYARLNTGEIVKVIGIKENKINKKAIYFEPYDEYNWCDSMAVKSFSGKIIDLIEIGDIIEIQNKLDGAKTIFDLNKYTIDIYKEQIKNKSIKILSILTHEQYEQNSYKVGDIE